jgi:hypothetical protein
VVVPDFFLADLNPEVRQVHSLDIDVLQLDLAPGLGFAEARSKPLIEFVPEAGSIEQCGRGNKAGDHGCSEISIHALMVDEPADTERTDLLSRDFRNPRVAAGLSPHA